MKQLNAGEVLKNLLDKNENQIKEAEQEADEKANCDECLKFGGIGVWKKPERTLPNGYYSAETTCFCTNRENCTKLGPYREELIERNKKQSNLGNLLTKKIKEFEAKVPFQKVMKKLAADYASNFNGDWFMLCGQSGSGKTHICSAICNKLLNDGKRVKYTTYSNLMNITSNYDFERLEEFKNIKILFIDDLFKTNPTEYDRRVMFELIDYRYKNHLTTIVSSELPAQSLLSIDEAIIGRIIEKCGIYFFEVPRDTKNNYRIGGNNGKS